MVAFGGGRSSGLRTATTAASLPIVFGLDEYRTSSQRRRRRRRMTTTTRLCSSSLAASAATADDDDETTLDYVAYQLQTLQQQIQVLNGGRSINCNSPRQVAAAVLGTSSSSSNAQTITKAGLQQIVAAAAAAGENSDPAQRQQQQLARLILEYKSYWYRHRWLLQQQQQQSDRTSTITCTNNNAVPLENCANDNAVPNTQNQNPKEIDIVATDTISVPKPISTTASTTTRRDKSDMRITSSYEDLVNGFFKTPKNQIRSCWKDALLQITRPTARALVAQLQPEHCPMGYDPCALPVDNPVVARRSTATDETSITTTSSSSALLLSIPTTAITTSTAGKRGSFLAFCREQKEKYSDCVILTRCGDFYETFGTDAILLVEHCGLNAMAGKAKAGCPIRNVQATLDCLTAAGFRVAVYEEGSIDPNAAKVRNSIKSRFLAQIVSSASPTYLYDLVLTGGTCDALAETGSAGPMSRPYVGVLSSSRAGYTLTEVSVEERTVRVSERLTAEAVACRLAAYPPSDPLLYVPSPSEYETRSTTATALPFLPSRRDTFNSGPGSRLQTRILPPTLVQQEGGAVSEVVRAKNIIVSALLQLTERKVDDTDESSSSRRATVDNFTLVSSSSSSEESSTSNNGGTRTNPLYLETATQLGLMNDAAIPSLVSYLLPDCAPAATRRFLRRLLLTPPPPAVANAMAALVSCFLHDDGPALPPLSVPPVGKVLAMIRAGQASAQVYSELLRALCATNLVLDVLISRPDQSNVVVTSLMTLLEYESGMAADPLSLRRRCLDAISVIEDVLCPIHHASNKNKDDGLTNYDRDEERVTDFGDLIPRAFFERNEVTWRGRVRREAAPEAYQRVQESAAKLADVVARDFWGLPKVITSEDDANKTFFVQGRKNLIVQDIFNNLIALKEIPSAQKRDEKYVHPRDRNGKILRNRYTTEAVQSAISDYVAACDDACDEVSVALVRLSQILHDDGHIPAIVQASHANLILSAAFYHAVKANTLGWSLAETVEASAGIDSAGHFHSVWPYWIDRSEAVGNTFDLNGMWVLTAPNMSGKSTIMRSTAAAALLTVCGLCAPLKPGSTIRRFDHIFVRGASSDVPTEQKSAFGAEMGDVAALLRCCGKKSLVFVDELGRGTSPRDGTRLSGAVLEAMAEAGMSGIFATHLHDILKLPLQSLNRISKKRMAIHERDNTGYESSRYSWTYRLEDGVCIDSMALVTAEMFGLPSHVIERAEALSEYLPLSSPVVPFLARTENDDSDREHADSFRSTVLPEIAKVVTETTGQQTVEIAPNWIVPASTDGKSAAYILKLDTEPARYYVGETNNLRKRIEQHRAKGGIWRNLEAFIIPAPQGKSQARMWESQLIRKMATSGFEMQSINDGRTHRTLNNGHFVDDNQVV